MVEFWHVWLYRLDQVATELVANQLHHLSPISFAIVWAAGLFTSLSPCMLSMLPITVGYIGGYADQRSKAAWLTAWFTLGLAITLTGLGLGAALLGRIYGQVGSLWGILMAGVAIGMGLNLLEVLPIRFPNWLGQWQVSKEWPQAGQSLMLGLTFGLVASPCSTPVLIALLGWISTTANAPLGAGLLFAYALGLVAPLLLAGLFTSVIKQLLTLRRWSGWLTYASGALLVGFGTISLLVQLT
ncbi:MAG: cytochrome c biogenesis protein CcdA [Cyanobacteriota bacterium]|nr:cytochrome c biogenesis protein CcdA [Cyanobacteriota bacterium]